MGVATRSHWTGGQSLGDEEASGALTRRGQEGPPEVWFLPESEVFAEQTRELGLKDGVERARMGSEERTF